jgi:hypothetical protein
MPVASETRLERRVARAAEETLAARKFVTPVDVLIGLGWLHPVHLDRWRQRRVENLERLIQVGPDRVASAMELFRCWATARGLEPSEAEYVARSRAQQRLRFTSGGDDEVERAFRTHWLTPELSERERVRLTGLWQRPPELVVISPLKDFTCSECGNEGSGLLMMEDAGPLCMKCADLDHLVFLPYGDAALTRRAKVASGLHAVVVRFSRSRRRYERRGILVTEEALERAETECLADEHVRARRREREVIRRAHEDLDLQARMAGEIVRTYPNCPSERAWEIARHTASRGSRRVGPSVAGRALDPRAIELAVAASVRHHDTAYDELLMSGADRETARAEVREAVARTLERWRGR